MAKYTITLFAILAACAAHAAGFWQDRLLLQIGQQNEPAPVVSSGSTTDATLRVWYQYAADTSTNYYDSTSNGLNANAVSATAPTWTNGTVLFTVTGQIRTRTPTDSRLNVGTNNYTWSVWVKPLTLDATRYIIGKYFTTGNQRGYLLSLGTDGKLSMLTSPDGTSTALATTTANAVLSTGVWYQVTCVKSNTAMTFYTNGAAVANSASGSHGTVFASSADFFIGAYQDGTTGYWSGYIDDVQCWGRNLNSAEVASNYTATAAPTPARP